MASVRRLTWTYKGTTKETWVCEYTDALGKRRRVTPKTGLKKDAEAARRKIEAELERGEHVAISQTITVAECVDAYLRHCHERLALQDRMTRATIEMYRQAIGRFLPMLGNVKLTNLTLDQIQAAVTELVDQGMKGSTVHHSATRFTAVLRFAVEREWLKRSPLEGKKLRVPPKERRAAIPSHDEIRIVLEAAAHRAPHEQRLAQCNRLAIVILALFGGLRRGEIAGLQWRDVDAAKGVLHVRHSLSRLDGLKAPKTKAGIRPVPLVYPIREALRALKEHWPDAKPSDHVLQTYRGKPVVATSVTSDYWIPLLRRTGLLKEDGKPKYRFHDLRHTAVSLLIDQGLSPLHIKNMIGHASVTTTLDVYGHMFPNDEAIKIAADQVAAGLYAPKTRQQITSG